MGECTFGLRLISWKRRGTEGNPRQIGNKYASIWQENPGDVVRYESVKVLQLSRL
jgi:hypothetical protein